MSDPIRDAKNICSIVFKPLTVAQEVCVQKVAEDYTQHMEGLNDSQTYDYHEHLRDIMLQANMPFKREEIRQRMASYEKSAARFCNNVDGKSFDECMVSRFEDVDVNVLLGSFIFDGSSLTFSDILTRIDELVSD